MFDSLRQMKNKKINILTEMKRETLPPSTQFCQDVYHYKKYRNFA